MGARTRAHTRHLLLGLALVSLTTLSLVGAEQQAAVKQEHQQKQSLRSTTDTFAPTKHQASELGPLSSVAQEQQQQVAEKKQGDQVVDSLFNTDEYVQIKPEEITKELDAASLTLPDLPGASAAAAATAGSSQPVAEHKSAADDELSAHLAQEPISSLESGPRPYATPADSRAARPQHAPTRGGYMPPRGPSHPGGYSTARGPKSRPYGSPAPMGRGPRAPMVGPGRYPAPPPPPPSHSTGYMSLKGKIADGLSSMVPHPSHPYDAPLQPVPHRYTVGNRPPSPYHASSSSVAHPPRYLPRGAAAGYAAFREFVRAQAHRYKQQSAAGGSLGSHEPLAYNAAPPAGALAAAPPSSGYGSAPGQVGTDDAYRNPGAKQQPTAHIKPYGEDSKQPEQTMGYGDAQPGARTKVTVAQAYIPHLAPQAAPADAGPPSATGYGSGSQSAASAYAAAPTNPILAKLYGAHAPQGVGRPEYSKDYGMVIHYPQATVYTEPMTVDQLHKLAGSSIGQILEQLQYNLVSGHRDEANTIRANNKHHLGHGVSIHAKEYYAPGKSGQYVPTTAAVISTSDGSDGSKYGGGAESASGASQQEPQAASAYSSALPSYNGAQQEQHHQSYGSASQNVEAATYGLKPELGSGYDRVRAAVAAGGGNKHPGHQGPAPQSYPHQSHRPAASGYGLPNGSGMMKPYEPLGHIASLIGSELESLYNKANSVLAKQIDPEIHAHVQAHLKTLSKVASPLKMTELAHESPLVLRPATYGPAPGSHQMRNRAPRRPSNAYRGQSPQSARPGANPAPRYPPAHGPRPQQRPGHYGGQRPQAQQHAQPQQQHASYNSAEQAFQQQMAQMLSDFNLGEENYGAKSQPIQATNQGYPNKVMQKHYQQQQNQQQSANSLPYEHSDGLEIPRGPNDQIGEISELIDALKGTLETHKPEGYGSAGPPTGSKDHGKLEDVRYLATALGQVPSYAIQVPVGHPAPQQQQQQQHHHQYQQYQQPGRESAPAYSETPKKMNEYVAGPQHHHQQQQYQPAQGYQQQAPAAQPVQAVIAPQLPYQAPPAPQAPQNGHGSAPAAQNSVGQSAIESHSAYQQQQEYSQVPAAGQDTQAYGQAYGAGQQQQPQQDSYGGPQVATSADYGKLLSDIGMAYGTQGPSQQQHEQTHGPSGQQQQYQPAQSYQQPAQAVEQQAVQGQIVEQPQPQPLPQPQPQQAYSANEHTQVINHLVPVQQQQQPAAVADYGSPAQSTSQQPAALQAIASNTDQQPQHQISVAAPTESQYQSAQPLSSFVDSPPSDYQELLRQPAGHAALLDGASHDTLYSSNATSVAAPNAHQHQHKSQQSQQHSSNNNNNYHHQTKYHAEQPHQLSSSASSVSSTYQKSPVLTSDVSLPSTSSSATASGTKSVAATPVVSNSASSSTSSASSSSSNSSSGRDSAENR